MIAAGFIGCDRSDQTDAIKQAVPVDRAPVISPDYSRMVIPPNIAPLNFIVREAGSKYYVKIYSKYGDPIEVFSKKPAIIIPEKPWKKLLNSSTGQDLYFEVFVKGKNDQWMRFSPITNTIAKENIDAFVVYRLMNPIYNFAQNTSIHQYNLETNTESVVMDKKFFGTGCINCHSFLHNSPENMTIGYRSEKYGSSTILAHAGKTEKLETSFGHTSWHPTGRLAAYSIYKVRQFFHISRAEVRDVVELDSAILYYSLDNQAVKTSPGLSDKQRIETHPTWSPDGKYLYFVSAPILWEDRDKMPPENFEKVQYDLMRISYDVETDQWGQIETVLSSEETGLSILFPRISPDGRFLLCVMCQYSCFSLFQQNSDLYMVDLKTGRYRKLENVNSDQAESWHSWSSNGRWIVFSSKRPEGIFTQLYFSYIDGNGDAHKPFILPQKDPEFYDSFYRIYNVPELITGPIKIDNKTLGRTVRSSEKIQVDLPISGASPKAGDSETEQTWR
jgi:hypothetical protein